MCITLSFHVYYSVVLVTWWALRSRKPAFLFQPHWLRALMEPRWQPVSRGPVCVSDSVRPPGLWPARLLCLWDSPGKNTGVRSHSLLQGSFPIPGWNLDLPHCVQICYLSHQGSLWCRRLPGSRRSPGEGKGSPLQYSCLEDPVDRGACWAIKSMGSRVLDTT